MKSRSVANEKSGSPDPLWLLLSPMEYSRDQLNVIGYILSMKKSIVVLNGAGISVNSGGNLETALPTKRAYVYDRPRL